MSLQQLAGESNRKRKALHPFRSRCAMAATIDTHAIRNHWRAAAAAIAIN
jgi:hypothetical protein